MMTAQQRLLRTPLTTLLGIRHPIIQGVLNYVGSSGLSAAVANGGGLGLISALRQPSALELRHEIRATKRAIQHQDCPGAIGVNMTLLPTMATSQEHELFQTKKQDDYIEALVDEGIRVVETSGPLQPALMDKLKHCCRDPPLTLLHKCTNLRDAQQAQDLGVDAILLEGFECAGVPGEHDVGNWVLQAAAAANLTIPFVATGGIGNGRQLAAALALGASGIGMGTRFLATQEANLVDDTIKQALVTNKSNTNRVNHNNDNDNNIMGRTAFPGIPNQVEEKTGVVLRPQGVRLSVWSCGAVVALMDDVPTCKDLMERIVADAVNVMDALPTSVITDS